MRTRYMVKLVNDFTEPYWMIDDPGSIVRHKSNDEYVVYDNEHMFYKILEDFLDAPKKLLTEKEIQKDFGVNREHKLSKKRVEVIKTYYNGRLNLKKAIYADLDKVLAKKLKKGFPIVLKYNIPIEMNYFSCEDNDPCDAKVELNDAYIEIELSKVE